LLLHTQTQLLQFHIWLCTFKKSSCILNMVSAISNKIPALSLQ
jgi:hypothetical protein